MDGHACRTEADPLKPETFPFPKERITKVYQDCTYLFVGNWECNINFRKKKIRELLAYIAVHYAENITLDFALRHTGMGKSLFAELFRMETGTSFVAYINKVRLEHAARMLVETDLPCNIIGYDCGFTTLSLFYKLFKLCFGKAPGAFRY
jgi:AraC-like DNA-binding protein